MSPTANAYRCGDFLIDPDTRELLRGGERLALPAKSFDCVVYLLQQRDRAVGRDELIAAVWGRVDVSDSVLNQTILHARRAFEDTGREQQYIRTVVGYGYRWVAPTVSAPSAPVAAAPPEIAAVVAPVAAATPVRRRSPRRLLLVVAALSLVAAIAAAWFALDRRAHDTRSSDAAARTNDAVLVLPALVGDTPDAPWMRLGLMDLIAERLRSSGRKVVASDNVVELARAFDTADPAELARLAAAASAALVLEPQVSRDGERWQVNLRAVYGQPASLAASGVADDAPAAATAAADDLAAQLGLARPARLGDAGAPSLRTLLLQVEAATLNDRLDEARALIERAPPGERDQPEVVFRLAKIDAQAGHLDAATASLTRLRDQVTAERDAVLRARVLDALGVIALRRNDPATAEPLHAESIHLLADSGNQHQLGKAYADRAAARMALRRDEEALADFASARLALSNAGDSLSLTFVDSNFGAFELLRDRQAEAIPILERAAARFESLRVHYAALNAWDAVAQARLILLDPATAATIEPRLRDLSARVNDPRSRLTAGLTRVEILDANGTLRAADELFESLQDELVRLGDAILQGRAEAIEARRLLAAGNASRAAVAAGHAFARLDQPDDSRQRLRNGLTLVRAQIAARDFDAAAASLARFAAQSENDGAAGTVYATLAKAELAAARGDADTARTAFEQALAAADQGRVPLDLLQVVDAYASWLITTRATERASAVAERVAPWAAQSYPASLLQLRLYHSAGSGPAWRTALIRTRALAGERVVPALLQGSP
ncbi:transcriptional regulator [Dokdonella sp.]|uniref:winged helix-turn-helix domain-containing protein n=1 Tax=Dokdonella sp. TaxID=2291710 RepID=UPI001B1C4763|nr:transcriptional regulator [Dokdonella sp.]MBO9663121.1 transcriptional regulator [Dokdonella sp.]